MTVIVGRGSTVVKLPSVKDYVEESTPVKRHDANSAQVLETIRGLHEIIDTHSSFVMDMW